MDFDNQTTASTPLAPKSKRPNWKRLGLILGILILVAAAGVAGYLYWNEKNRADDLSTQLNQNITQGNESETPPVGSGETEPEPTTYSTTPGKFRLTLDAKYTLIEEHNGGGEGGNWTHLVLGQKLDSGNNVILAYDYGRLEIHANHTSINQGSTYAQLVDGALKDYESEEIEPITIDGVEASVFKVSSLFNEKFLFFQKDKIFYQISLLDEAEQNKQLSDVVKGFKFN